MSNLFQAEIHLFFGQKFTCCISGNFRKCRLKIQSRCAKTISGLSAAFRAEVEVAVSPTFYAWLSEYSGQIKIVAPDAVRSGYIAHLEKLLSSVKE
ncbi:MAG: WYL domain-containing protein [Lachnospiraceae bacterium]|nr:WYL domain-containing protein [Lachnospiraceae bacterium]